MTPSSRTINVRGIGDLLAFVATQLGYHPAENVVLVGLRGQATTGHPLVAYALVFDLPSEPAEKPLLVEAVGAALQRHQQDGVILLGYGPGARVTPVIDACQVATAERDIVVYDAVRVEDGRYWSYQCGDPDCCPPQGRRYDLASSAITAAAVADGVQVLPSRRDLADTLAPQRGAAAAAMRAATDEARRWMTTITAHSAAGRDATAQDTAGRDVGRDATAQDTAGRDLGRDLGRDVAGYGPDPLVAGAGLVGVVVDLVTAALAVYRDGGQVSDEQVARVSCCSVTLAPATRL